MRLYTLVVSIVAHVAALIVLVIVPLTAMDALPATRGIKEFILADASKLPDPPPPPRPRSADRRLQSAARDLAPSEAPDRIAPEIEQPSVEQGVPFEGPPGVPSGDEGGIPLSVVSAPLPPPVPTPVRPGGKIRPPQRINDVAPVYPPLAQQNKVQGIVILEAVIGENGRVRDVRVLRSIPLLDRAAIDAVRQWQFTPTTLNGEPVPVVMTVTVSFELKP